MITVVVMITTDYVFLIVYHISLLSALVIVLLLLNICPPSSKISTLIMSLIIADLMPCSLSMLDGSILRNLVVLGPIRKDFSSARLIRGFRLLNIIEGICLSRLSLLLSLFLYLLKVFYSLVVCNLLLNPVSLSSCSVLMQLLLNDLG